MKRSSRLTRSEDIHQVRQQGQSFVHDAIVINVLSNEIKKNRIAIIAGRSVGGAVQRNLAKRRIRSIVQNLFSDLSQGYDLVIIARSPFLQYDYQKLNHVLQSLLRRAELLKVKDC